MNDDDPIFYVDTSVLLPYYRRESTSPLVERWFSQLTEPVRISSLTQVEFVSALARVVRMNELNDVHAGQITNLFEQECKGGWFLTMPLSTVYYEQAKTWLLSRTTALRTLDALHLACSHGIGAEIVTADRTLHDAATYLDIQSQLIA